KQEIRVLRDLRRGIEAAVEVAVPVDHVLLPRAVRCPSAALLVDRALEHVGGRDLVQRAEGGRRIDERLETLGGEEARNGLQVRDVAQVMRMPLRQAGRVGESHFGDVDQATSLTDDAIARSSAATVGYWPASASRLPISTSAGITPGHSVLAPRNQRPCPTSRAVWKVLPGINSCTR